MAGATLTDQETYHWAVNTEQLAFLKLIWKNIPDYAPSPLKNKLVEKTEQEGSD